MWESDAIDLVSLYLSGDRSRIFWTTLMTNFWKFFLKSLSKDFCVHIKLRITTFAEKPISNASNGNKYSFDETSLRTSTKFRHLLLSSMTSFRMIFPSNKTTKSFNFLNKKSPNNGSACNKVKEGSRSLHVELLNSEYAGKMTHDVFLNRRGIIHLLHPSFFFPLL